MQEVLLCLFYLRSIFELFIECQGFKDSSLKLYNFTFTAISVKKNLFLCWCARYWAEQGSRVLFISKTPLKNLPLTIGKISSLNPDAFKLIQFMYLADWQELLQQLYSLHLRHNPVSVIIIKNLENYFKTSVQVPGHEDHVSLICASLLYAVSTCAKILSQPAFLINDYTCENSSIEKSVVKNFFHNIWELNTSKDENEKTFIRLSRVSRTTSDEITDYTFYENADESMLSFCKVILTTIL